MDFVVAGLGFGALIVVIGFVIRDLGPLLWKRLGRGANTKHEDEQDSWRRLCFNVSSIMTAAGCVVLVATIVAVVLDLTDRQGALVVLATSVVSMIAMAIGIVVAIRNYQQGPMVPRPAYGNLSQQSASPTVRRLRRPEAPVAASAAAVSESSPVAPAPEQAVAAEPEPEPEPEIDPDEPFDPTRLLPSEFDERFEESGAFDVALTATGDGLLWMEPPVPPAAEPESEPVPSEESPPAQPTGGFKSRLLADIGAPEKNEPENGAFASGLLADVDTSEVPDGAAYRSSLLADLTQSGEESNQPEESADAEGDSEQETAQADGEPAVKR